MDLERKSNLLPRQLSACSRYLKIYLIDFKHSLAIRVRRSRSFANAKGRCCSGGIGDKAINGLICFRFQIPEMARGRKVDPCSGSGRK